MTNGPASLQIKIDIAGYALSVPRLVEPNPSCEPFGMCNPSCEPFGMWDGYKSISRFDFSFSRLVAQALDVGRARTIRDRRHQASDHEIYLSSHRSGVCTEKLT